MNWLGQCITYFGLYIIYSGILAQRNNVFGFNLSIAIMCILGGGVFVVMGGSIVNQSMKRKQKADDERANEIIKTIGKD
jgi:hypothetical protein